MFTEVLAYETVSVTSGTYKNTMKIRQTKYDANDNVFGEPTIFWVDKNVRMVKGLYEESGTTIELIEYSPAK